jgi:hypothetical protein
MSTGIVIPVGADRLDNLKMVLACVAKQTVKPRVVVVVCDGEDAHLPDDPEILHGVPGVPVAILRAPKHEPGKEQPRNVGARLLGDLGRQDERFAGIKRVWFLDSDVMVVSKALELFELAAMQHPRDEQPVLLAPYDWLVPGVRTMFGEAKPDMRWASFEAHEPWEAVKGDLSMGLACFSGNAVWPLDEFERVGGFWNELHNGRCEDGELGLRAVAMGVPIAMVREARGFHLWHGGDPAPTPEWTTWARGINDIDVPKIKERHAWKELPGDGTEIFVVEEDGHRFNCRCHCGWEGNTAEIWNHKRECKG